MPLFKRKRRDPRGSEKGEGVVFREDILDREIFADEEVYDRVEEKERERRGIPKGDPAWEREVLDRKMQRASRKEMLKFLDRRSDQTRNEILGRGVPIRLGNIEGLVRSQLSAQLKWKKLRQSDLTRDGNAYALLNREDGVSFFVPVFVGGSEKKDTVFVEIDKKTPAWNALFRIISHSLRQEIIEERKIKMK